MQAGSTILKNGKKNRDTTDIPRKCGEILTGGKLTLAVAESCTGGLISHMLTDIPGSSRYLLAGVVAYSNRAKTSLLKVPEAVIKKHGAVSSQTARHMAEGVREIISSDLGIGVTGIAGPGGATDQKPVGTVYIAVFFKDKTTCKKFAFTGNRGDIKLKTALAALEMLKNALTNQN